MSVPQSTGPTYAKYANVQAAQIARGAQQMPSGWMPPTSYEVVQQSKSPNSAPQLITFKTPDGRQWVYSPTTGKVTEKSAQMPVNGYGSLAQQAPTIYSNASAPTWGGGTLSATPYAAAGTAANPYQQSPGGMWGGGTLSPTPSAATAAQQTPNVFSWF
jgi:hypothetical protein